MTSLFANLTFLSKYNESGRRINRNLEGFRAGTLPQFRQKLAKPLPLPYHLSSNSLYVSIFRVEGKIRFDPGEANAFKENNHGQ
jgi:hypothetical protein